MKELSNTKVTVRLRKAEDRKEWYLYLESYPVFVAGKIKPQRIREYLNRTVTTVEWDKKRVSRTDMEGKKAYKPKRDDNGLIVCRSERDRENIFYADNVRKIRQREYDNTDLYTETEAEQAEYKERLQQNFIEYFKQTMNKRHGNSSTSIYVNWERALDFFKMFAGDTLLFSQINTRMAEEFKTFLLSAPRGGGKEGCLSQNSASTYFSIFKAVLKQAFIDGYLMVDLSAKIKGIAGQETRREFLTVDELNKLASTPCERPELKRASLFSALTGLRHCDIQKLKWKEIVIINGEARINFTQQKTKGVEYMPISGQALGLCGERRKPENFVFESLPDPSWISAPLKRWIESAGITKKITFHCFRHTFATLQLFNGTDIYTVSKMLGHRDVKTTQIYAKIVDESKRKAVNKIQLNLNIN